MIDSRSTLVSHSSATNLVQLAQRIRSVRTDRQLTLEQLAERTGLTRSVLSKFENFRVTPSLGALGNIAEALGVTMSELLDAVDEKPRMVVAQKDERLPLERDRPGAGASCFIARPVTRGTRPTPMRICREFTFVINRLMCTLQNDT